MSKGETIKKGKNMPHATNREKALINAAEKFGFNLEFKTSRELEQGGFYCESNKIISWDNHSIEIDLIATSRQRPDLHLIIECKGANTDTILFLVKASNNRLENDKNYIANSSRYLIGSKKYLPICSIDDNNVVYTTTGDFISCSEKECKKLSKNDDQNNFYKAQKQILESVIAYSDNLNLSDETYPQFIVPIIVTNAQIWAVDYNGDKPKVSEQKGVLHRVIDDSNRLFIDGQSGGKQLTNSVVVPVINYQYLDVILEQLIGRSCFSSRINLDLRLEPHKP